MPIVLCAIAVLSCAATAVAAASAASDPALRALASRGGGLACCGSLALRSLP